MIPENDNPYAAPRGDSPTGYSSTKTDATSRLSGMSQRRLLDLETKSYGLIAVAVIIGVCGLPLLIFIGATRIPFIYQSSGYAMIVLLLGPIAIHGAWLRQSYGPRQIRIFLAFITIYAGTSSILNIALHVQTPQGFSLDEYVLGGSFAIIAAVALGLSVLRHSEDLFGPDRFTHKEIRAELRRRAERRDLYPVAEDREADAPIS